MDKWHERGRELWQGWTGHGGEAPGRVAELARELWNPVGENTPASDRFHQCWVDQELHDLARRQSIAPKPFWPNGAPYAFCLTHDIDRVLATVHRARLKKTSRFRRLRHVASDVSTALIPGGKPRNPYFNFGRMQALEAEWGIRSASYVLFEKRRYRRAFTSGEWQHVVGVYDPHSIRRELGEYARGGNEVGLHGSFDSWNSFEALQTELRQLESFGVGPVQGVRNHYLNFDPELTLPNQLKAGVLYDSTLGFNLQNGFRCGTSFPFYRQGQLEIPFCLMDSALRYQLPTVEERLSLAQALLGEVRRHGGVLIVNWHLQVMNAEAFPSEVEQVAALVRQAQADGAWICCPRDVAAHWKQRHGGLCADPENPVK